MNVQGKIKSIASLFHGGEQSQFVEQVYCAAMLYGRPDEVISCSPGAENVKDKIANVAAFLVLHKIRCANTSSITYEQVEALEGYELSKNRWAAKASDRFGENTSGTFKSTTYRNFSRLMKARQTAALYNRSFGVTVPFDPDADYARLTLRVQAVGLMERKVRMRERELVGRETKYTIR